MSWFHGKASGSISRNHKVFVRPSVKKLEEIGKENNGEDMGEDTLEDEDVAERPIALDVNPKRRVMSTKRNDSEAKAIGNFWGTVKEGHINTREFWTLTEDKDCPRKGKAFGYGTSRRNVCFACSEHYRISSILTFF